MHSNQPLAVREQSPTIILDFADGPSGILIGKRMGMQKFDIKQLDQG